MSLFYEFQMKPRGTYEFDCIEGISVVAYERIISVTPDGIPGETPENYNRKEFSEQLLK